MTAIHVTDTRRGVEFRFPFDAEIVALIKDVRGRHWDPVERAWILHFGFDADAVIRKARALGHTVVDTLEVPVTARPRLTLSTRRINRTTTNKEN